METLSPSLQALYDLIQSENILSNETLILIGYNPNLFPTETARLQAAIDRLNKLLPPEEHLTLVAHGSDLHNEFPVYMRACDVKTPPTKLSKK